jgi:hypothetical protein
MNASVPQNSNFLGTTPNVTPVVTPTTVAPLVSVEALPTILDLPPQTPPQIALHDDGVIPPTPPQA